MKKEFNFVEFTCDETKKTKVALAGNYNIDYACPNGWYSYQESRDDSSPKTRYFSSQAALKAYLVKASTEWVKREMLTAKPGDLVGANKQKSRLEKELADDENRTSS